MHWTRVIAPLAAGAVAAAVASPAYAGNCSSLPGPLYITGSSAVKNFLAKIGTAIATASPTNGPTIVYASPGSCQGVDAIFNGTKMTGTATYWDATGNAQTCQLDTSGDTADVGVSDVYFTSCDSSYMFPTALPAGVGEFFGPNQIMNFVVPTASSQNIISAQAAYLVLGFPNGGPSTGVAPWGNTNNDANIFQRGYTSGTQAMISVAIGVPPSKWQGTMVGSGGTAAMVTDVGTSATPNGTLGILASDAADANRSTIKQLAYQAYGQDCAWLPDSSSTTKDKKNVRDGQYAIWGPIHFYAKVGASGTPTNPEAANLVGYFDGSVPPPLANGYQDLIALEGAGSVVPDCAMQVKRTSEVGPVASYAPATPCGCFWEKSANGSTSCNACASDSECTAAGAPKCRYGYCEAN